ncbi:hypothetical protein DsansV1_C04g0043881 [Dioscorea sansibarensis]
MRHKWHICGLYLHLNSSLPAISSCRRMQFSHQLLLLAQWELQRISSPNSLIPGHVTWKNQQGFLFHQGPGKIHIILDPIKKVGFHLNLPWNWFVIMSLTFYNSLE